MFAIRKAVVAIAAIASQSSLIEAQHAPSAPAPSMLESYQKARSLIDAAVSAHGGLESLRSGRHIRVIADGWDYHRTQGRSLSKPYDSTVARSDLMLDLTRNRIARTRTRGWPGGFHYVDWYISDSARHFYVEPRNHRYSSQQYPPADQQYGNLFLVPSWYVLAAHEATNPGVRRYLGRMRLPGGGEVDAVQYTIPPSGTVVIGLDPASHRLRAVLSVGTDVFTGDTEVVTEFLDWRPVPGGPMMPARSVHYRGGEVASAVRFTVTPNYPIPDSMLTPPSGFAVVTQDPPPPSVRELAPGVWTVGSGSKSLVVAFSDHVVVVDAPSSTSAEVISTVRTLAPGKPIRYVIPTHHHDDHFMGVRYHAAAGTTVVTTPGNVDYLRRIMTAPMSSLMLARNQVPPSANYRVETIDGNTRTFTDGSRSLEIHRIASPHAVDMLVAWMPGEGILFQADLIEAPQAGIALRGANAVATTHLADVIRGKAWNVRVFAGAHATLQNPQVFTQLVSLPILPPT